MTEEKIGHRPLGSGYTTIRIVKRTDPSYGRDGQPIAGSQNAGYFLYIGRKLWQDLGSPERVIIFRINHQVYIDRVHVLRQEQSYAVSGANQNARPKISIGQSKILEFGLVEGEYQAEIKGNMIVFSIDQQVKSEEKTND